MTEVTRMFIDTIIAWFQTASTITGYLWIEQGGVVVGGSKTTPVAAVPAQTGNTLTDLKGWISAALQELMGVIPPDATYAYPTALAMANTWGIDDVPADGTYSRSFVALAYTADFNFGALAIPDLTVPGTERKVYFSLTSIGLPEEVSPAADQIKKYIDSENKFPVLLTLELNGE